MQQAELFYLLTLKFIFIRGSHRMPKRLPLSVYYKGSEGVLELLDGMRDSISRVCTLRQFVELESHVSILNTFHYGVIHSFNGLNLRVGDLDLYVVNPLTWPASLEFNNLQFELETLQEKHYLLSLKAKEVAFMIGADRGVMLEYCERLIDLERQCEEIQEKLKRFNAPPLSSFEEDS